MKYILMMNCPRTGYDTFGAWPKKDIQAHIALAKMSEKENRHGSGPFLQGLEHECFDL